VDYAKGIAISSIVHTDDHSHFEIVRYGQGLELLPAVLAAARAGQVASRRGWAETVRILRRHGFATAR
jgi:hypothetical protein